MRKVILSFLLFGLFGVSKAQFVPNGDFTTTTNPTHWLSGGGNVQLVNQVDLGAAGVLKGEDGGYFGFIQNSSTNVGVILTEKFAFTGRPASLRFLATYFPVKAGETLGIFVQFTRKNVDSNRTDTIGRWFGNAAPGTINPWRELTLDLTNYLLPDNPDSAVVAFFATINAGAGVGTALCVDNVKFSTFTGSTTSIDNHFYGEPTVQPNPVNSGSNSKIYYTLNGESQVKIAVYDVMGRKVADIFEGTETNGEHAHSLSNSDLQPGTYLVKISTGAFEKTQRIVVQ